MKKKKVPPTRRTVFRQKIEAKGMTATGWCRIHGFSYSTLDAFLAGKIGLLVGTGAAGPKSQAIHDQMVKDGLQ